MTRHVFLTMLILVLAGCGVVPRPIFRPTVNAQLKNDQLMSDRKGTGAAPDVVIVARCREVSTFGEERKGNWKTLWYVVRFDVMSVERGTWCDKDLSYICFDTWPTPESGILVDKGPFPYRMGMQMRFGLDNHVVPAMVVEQTTIATAPRP